MAFEAEKYRGEIHLYAASLEKPEDFKPEFHVHKERKLPWLALDDNLDEYSGFKT